MGQIDRSGFYIKKKENACRDKTCLHVKTGGIQTVKNFYNFFLENVLTGVWMGDSILEHAR